MTKIEFDFVNSLYASSSSTPRPSLEAEVNASAELAETLVGRRVFARNDAQKDKENEGKGKWCRAYVEAANAETHQVARDETQSLVCTLGNDFCRCC